MNTATLQGFNRQLDENYIPSTNKEKETFALRQKHLYAILNTILWRGRMDNII